MTHDFQWIRTVSPAEQPDGETSSRRHRFWRHHPRTLRDYANQDCLVLLGEPGSGKSVEFAKMAQAARAELDVATLEIDLLDIHRSKALEARLSAEPAFLAWRRDEADLHLFLDSADETRLLTERLGRLLSEKLEDGPLSRLSLRMACRTLNWARVPSLRNDLGALWPDLDTPGAGVLVLALDSLSPEDANPVLAHYGLAEDASRAAIRKHGLRDLITRPLDLIDLVELISAGEALHKGRRETLVAITRRRCEPADGRRWHDASTNERLSLAMWMATVNVLCDRSWVSIARVGSEPPDNDCVHATEISESFLKLEAANGERRAQVLPSVQDLLSQTSLLALGEPKDRFTWADRSRAEALTAHYLLKRGTGAGQLLNLLTYPGDEGGPIVPTLLGVASQLIDDSTPTLIVERLIDEAPAVLLQGDVHLLSEHHREALVEQLLRQAHTLRRDDRWRLWRPFEKLKWSGLEGQLRIHLAETGPAWASDDPESRAQQQAHVARRYLAILMTTGCQLIELARDLRLLALDITQPVPTRSAAAEAVCHLDDPDEIVHLRELVLNESPPSEEGRVVGPTAPIVEALFKHRHIDVDELFEVLEARPHAQPFTRFAEGKQAVPEAVLEQLWERGGLKGMTQALNWIRTLDSEHLGSFAESVLGWCLRNAAKHPGLIKLMLPILLDCARRRQDLGSVSEHLRRAPQARRAIAKAVVHSTDWNQKARNTFALSMFGGGIHARDPADMSWLLDRAESEDEPIIPDRWLEWVSRTLGGAGTDAYMTFVERYDRAPEQYAPLRHHIVLEGQDP